MRLTLYRGYWCATWREDGETKRQSLRTKDRAVAERALADFRRTPAASTVAEIYTAYLHDKGTERAAWAWRQLGPHFGALRPDQVDRAACRSYTAARRRTVGDGTIHTELTYLRAALLWQNKQTSAVVELPSKPPPKDDALTREQYQRLLAAADTPHIRLFIILALATGARAQALLDLTWDRVSFERGTIQLGDGRQRRKGRATVPMNDHARAALEQAASSRTCDYVIEWAGGPIKRIIKGFRTTAHEAGLPWCSPHVLRHTAAVWMAEAGVSMNEIAQVLGHSDSRITERVYARFRPGHLAKAVKGLG